MAKKSPLEKMNSPMEVEIIHDLPAGNRWCPAGGSMVISTPREIEALVKQVPYGSVVTVDDLRRRIAQKHGAEITCPMTTGIFLRIVAEAAEQLRSGGEPDVAPYWRVVRRGGELHDRYPGGPERHAALLEREGIVIERRRGKLFVLAEHLGL